MQSKSFNAKLCLSSGKRKNPDLVIHVPVKVLKELNLKPGQIVKARLMK